MRETKTFEYCPQKSRALDPEQVSEAILLHEAGWSNVAIGRKLGRHNSSISRLFKKLSCKSVKEDMKASKKKKLNRAVGVTAPETQTDMAAVTFRIGDDNRSGRDSGSESLLQEIARLKKELRDARLERDLYNEIINVAEKKFDIQIRKKAGAKQ